VWEFYANLYQRRGDSFRTWLRGRSIEVTPTLISEIIGAPRVRDPIYPYSVDHLLARADLVACFTEGRPYQIELEGEGSFQMSDSATTSIASTTSWLAEYSQSLATR
jgi:hypothetical protein